MNGKLRSLAILFGLASFLMGATASDVTSSKNELLVKGADPHVRYVDESGDDYQTTVDGDIYRVSNLDGVAVFNIPPDGTMGVERAAPTSPAVTPFTTGGSLADGSYFFVVTALDGVGETIGSTEVQCTVSGGGGSGRCDLTWVAVMPPAVEYRVYEGTGSGLEDHYTGGIVGTSYSATTSPLATPGTPPDATTAHQVSLQGDGIHFGDGTIQNTAGGAGAWAFNGIHILNANTGFVGIFNGVNVFTPASKLNVISDGADTAITLDSYGVGLSNFKPYVIGRFARGSFASPTAALTNDVVASFAARAYGTTGFASGDGAIIQMVAAETQTDAAHGTKMVFRTTTLLNIINAVRMTIFSSGDINIGSSTSDPGILLNVEGAVTANGTLRSAGVLAGIVSDGLLTLKTNTHAATFTPGNEVFILCDAGGGAFTINLPSNAGGILAGRVYIIKNEGLVNNCTLDPAGAETIDLALATLAVTPGSTTRLVAHPSQSDWERW